MCPQLRKSNTKLCNIYTHTSNHTDYLMATLQNSHKNIVNYITHRHGYAHTVKPGNTHMQHVYLICSCYNGLIDALHMDTLAIVMHSKRVIQIS